MADVDKVLVIVKHDAQILDLISLFQLQSVIALAIDRKIQITFQEAVS